jgi:hypothetical protein
VILDGSKSKVLGPGQLSYSWKQIYGPSVISFDNSQIASPLVSGLEEGVYLFELSVSNGTQMDKDLVYVVSSLDSNIAPKVAINSPADKARFIANETFVISALASDLNGTISEVKLYEGQKLISSSTNSPYEFSWYGGVGTYVFTAVATDNNGLSTTSKPITIFIDSTPSCKGRAFNGDYEYVFSDDENNPTLTFIPSKTGVGSPTCILYYGNNAGSLPGYTVTPNTPYRLNASKGSLVYFYYTYSYPGAGEKNTSTNKNTYVIGSCKPFAMGVNQLNEMEGVQFYPNPVSSILTFILPEPNTSILVYEASGKLLDQIEINQTNFEYDMSKFSSGIYLFELKSKLGMKQIKIIK